MFLFCSLLQRPIVTQQKCYWPWTRPISCPESAFLVLTKITAGSSRLWRHDGREPISYLESSLLIAQAWRNERLSSVPLQDRFWLALKTTKMAGRKTSRSSLIESRACGIQPQVRFFSDFQSELPSAARFSTAGQGERRLLEQIWSRAGQDIVSVDMATMAIFRAK